MVDRITEADELLKRAKECLGYTKGEQRIIIGGGYGQEIQELNVDKLISDMANYISKTKPDPELWRDC